LGRFIVPVILTGIATIGVWGIWWSVGIVWTMAGASALVRYLMYLKKIGVKKENRKLITTSGQKIKTYSVSAR
jgi:Na+-driven multidrug efflux pump